ncbi:MAG: Nif3-like dinuclear metal center hexameric protein [Selenomonadaceae bacterium]|nr:Nif3-like dinuclear metal center hexameric protein [Selenomonadaceae bacterium]
MKKITVQNIADVMNRLAPKKLSEEWDNPGLLVGNPRAEVEKIFISLDVTEEVIKNAIDFGANLIVSHHPIIFHAVKNLRTDLPLGRKIEMLIKNDIAVFSAHTNLDSAIGGVNDVLAEKIGLVDVKMFGEEEISLGRIGKLSEKMTAKNFAEHVKKVLNAENVRLIDAGDFLIEKVGLCGGAGSDIISKAKFFGANCFVTGDVKYHEAQSAVENKIHVIDAGHFYTEFPIVHALAEILRNEFEKLDYKIKIAEDSTSRDFFQTI